MRTALVTCATGNIERLLVEGLVGNGYHVMGIARHSPAGSNTKLRFIRRYSELRAITLIG
ncbi:hypothetical protein [Thermococcus sp. 4557]|uniref:hypothetical protein n=1 Tax=Thermococcus sp. (strain CGMCC 1.5172 / 4557) TaxID=1042877 RepID=UPI00064FE2A1|nr:hypothetical protein [Thermococcus sp. 4557]